MDSNILAMMPLQQMLQEQLSGNRDLYVHALVKSRQETLTENTLSMLYELYCQAGDCWIQVIRRLLVNNFPQGFQLLKKCNHFIRPILSEMYALGTDWHRSQTHELIKSAIMQSVTNSSSLSIVDRSAMTETLSYHIDLAIKFNACTILEDILILINQCATITAGSFIDLFLLDFAATGSEWNWHKHSVQLLKSITWLLNSLQKYAVKRMVVQKFRILSQPIKNFIISPLLQKSINLFLLISNTNQKSLYQINGHTIERKKHFQFSDHLCRLLEMLTYICQTAELQDLFLDFSLGYGKMIIGHFLAKIDLVNLNRSRNQSEELISINYEIASGSYSDTLSGSMLKLFWVACRQIGSFYNEYFQQLSQMYSNIRRQLHSPHFSLSSQVINFLLKINILSHQSIYSLRASQLEPLLNELTSFLSDSWSHFDETTQVQILRFFLSFSSKENSNNNLVGKCIELCMGVIIHRKSSDIQNQCIDILFQLPQNEQVVGVISAELLPMLTGYLLQFSIERERMMSLFVRYLEKFPKLVSRSSQQILEYLNRAYRNQDNALRQKRLKSSQLMLKIIQGLTIIVQTQDELPFQAIDLYATPILNNLSYPQNIDYEEDLLTFLQALLSKQHHLTPETCIIMASLPKIYDKNEKKLSVLNPIIKSISTNKQLIQQIVFEYPDIIKMFLQLLVDYLQESCSIDYFSFYSYESKQLFNSIQIFLQAYCHKIQQDQDLYQLTCRNILAATFEIYKLTNSERFKDNTDQCFIEFRELLIQMMMTISHMSMSNRQFCIGLVGQMSQILKYTPIVSYCYEHSVKMVPVILSDLLIVKPEAHENIMMDIVNYYQTLKQYRKIHKFKSLGADLDSWTEWPSRPKVYIENVLRQLRSWGKIDQMEHIQYLQALNQHYC